MENTKKLYIPVIVGTTRPKRKSIHVAKLVHEVASTLPDVESELLDPADFNMPFDGNDKENKDPRYTEITERADAFYIVTPEYNHGYPGTLKRFLDSELKNYVHKPVAFAGVSSTAWGGVRAIEALVGSVREMGLVATFSDVNFPNIGGLFDDEGKVLDKELEKKSRERIKGAYEELVWMAKVLKHGRENIAQIESYRDSK